MGFEFCVHHNRGICLAPQSFLLLANVFVMAEATNPASVEPSARKAQDEDVYGLPRNEKEYGRLRDQHEMVKMSLGRRLLFTPVDMSNPDLRVLDSATGDGYWLADTAGSLAPTATLIGTDIAPQHFLPADHLPSNVTLGIHSIFEASPPDYQSSFDVVHQRFVLSLCSEAASADAVRKLFACVRPGGYIQLHEGDMTRIEEGPGHEAGIRFRDFMEKAWALLGYNSSPGPKLVQWLQDAGAVNVEEIVTVNKTGALAEDKTQGQRSMSVLLALMDGVAGIVKGRSAENFLRVGVTDF